MPSCGWQLWGRRRGSRAKRFFAPSPPHPLHCPTLMPKERGALFRVLPPDCVPTLQQAPEPGQHLVSTLGGGGGGGEGSPTRSPIPPDRRRGLRGAPEGPEESPGYVASCGALPCAPRTACLRRSHRPRRDGAGHDWVEWAGLALDTWCPLPLGSAAPQGVG